MTKELPNTANAQIIRTCIEIANFHGDRPQLMVDRGSPFITARCRQAANHSEGNAPTLDIDGTFAIRVTPQGECILSMDSCGDVDIRAVSGVFFAKAGRTIRINHSGCGTATLQDTRARSRHHLTRVK